MDLNNSYKIIPSNWDVIVIGAGAAGLMTCLEMPANLKILLLNRNTSNRSASRWAQGGIAAVTRSEDSLSSHAEDTFNAGAGLCDFDSVKMLVDQAPQCVQRLLNLGMDFDRDLNGLATTLEAAHSHRRVLHVQDRTGRALVDVLRDQVEQRSNILHRRGVRATQLLVENNRCLGVQVLDGPLLHWIFSRAVVLATGGGGHLFKNTTNPAQASGEGIALAWNAGAAIEDLEFVQFHPTAIKLDDAPCFLISEAVRGEGAVLVDRQGNSPVSHLERKDLSSRDQVSRALFQAMHHQKIDHIGLDLRNIPKDKLEMQFPSILQRCRDLGVDPLTNLIPVAPAAHYWMGGVSTDLQAATSLSGLYAVGEVACTGVHGANRLASNSLMECLVFARQMSLIELTNISDTLSISKKIITSNPSIPLSENINSNSLISSIGDLRSLCWKEAGVDRTEKGMIRAIRKIKKDLYFFNNEKLLDFIRNQTLDSCTHFNESSRKDLNLLLDLTHRQLTSLLMLQACLFRKESRGGHFRKDTPRKVPFWQCHSRQIKGKEISTRAVKFK
ncbi:MULTISPECIES: L-aspartate oxidase [Prochlorococcus]|uniref:L-aspartate oxidase n=1 Tax=Prochlorococcus TaxID=1218 RepID=UPI000533BD0B|nr:MULTISPECIES: L-aspartate oxidase [Prochlorococcus]KGG13276.1 L-aspartate oxidase [Prochlorococcus sp. MIT 0601]